MGTAIFCLWLGSIFCKDEDELFIINFTKTASLVWVGKPSSPIIAGGGHAQVNSERSWGDGAPVLQFMNGVYRDSTRHPVQGEGALG